MASKVNAAGCFVSLAGLMTGLFFLVLRWSGMIGWDYVWVLSPFWIPNLVGGLLHAALLVVAGFVKVAEEN